MIKKNILMKLLAGVLIAVMAPNVAVVGAVDCSSDGSPDCVINGTSHKDESFLPTINSIINLLIGITGIIAVAVIIYGGYQYVLSTGDAAKVAKAKNTIMYGIIGLVIAMLAFAIVNFVLKNVFGTLV